MIFGSLEKLLPSPWVKCHYAHLLVDKSGIESDLFESFNHCSKDNRRVTLTYISNGHNTMCSGCYIHTGNTR